MKDTFDFTKFIQTHIEFAKISGKSKVEFMIYNLKNFKQVYDEFREQGFLIKIIKLDEKTGLEAVLISW